MGMESLNLLPDLQKLPTMDGGELLDGDEVIPRVRAMDRGHFAIEVSQGTEETLEALLQERNVPDVLREGYSRAFSSDFEAGRALHEHYEEMVSRGPQSVQGFVSNLKGKVAELKAEDLLEERFPGYDFELAPSATQQGWDLIGRSQGNPELFVQVKAGAETYTGRVVESMQVHPNYPFAVSSEVYQSIAESHPELVGRLVDIGSAAELTESVKDGLGTLAGNFGIDVPLSLIHI